MASLDKENTKPNLGKNENSNHMAQRYNNHSKVDSAIFKRRPADEDGNQIKKIQRAPINEA